MDISFQQPITFQLNKSVVATYLFGLRDTSAFSSDFAVSRVIERLQRLVHGLSRISRNKAEDALLKDAHHLLQAFETVQELNMYQKLPFATFVRETILRATERAREGASDSTKFVAIPADDTSPEKIRNTAPPPQSTQRSINPVMQKVRFAMEFCARKPIANVNDDAQVSPEERKRQQNFLRKVSAFFKRTFPSLTMPPSDIIRDTNGSEFLAIVSARLDLIRPTFNEGLFAEKMATVALSILVGCILGHQHKDEMPSLPSAYIANISSNVNFRNAKTQDRANDLETVLLANTIWSCFADGNFPNNTPYVIKKAHDAWQVVQGQVPKIANAKYIDGSNRLRPVFAGATQNDASFTWNDLLTKAREGASVDPKGSSRTLLLLAGLLVLGTDEQQAIWFLAALAMMPGLVYTSKEYERLTEDYVVSLHRA